ncbi:MAG TPA: DUF1553 domain-containing protein, partial [Schlesneria sp.]
DPISIEDYYSLAGIFFSTRLIPGPVKGNTPLVRVPLLSSVEISSIHAEQARDKVRIAELSQNVNLLAQHEYHVYLERQIEVGTARYLTAAWELAHPEVGCAKPTLAELAKAKGLDATALTRWSAYFEEQHPHPALAGVRGATDKATAESRSAELAESLTAIGNAQRELRSRDSVAKTLTEAEVLRFTASDRRIATNEAQRVIAWPNRGCGPVQTELVSDVAAPTLTMIKAQTQSRAALHFAGNELLQAPVTVPAAGSLFIVYRLDPAGGPGQRLLGWEDASVGQHGIGIMTDAAGALHAIVRRNGASGDVTVPAASPVSEISGFQVLSLTWGPSGVTLHRQGQPVGTNKGIDSVSSDPAIAALRIGGPGSGASPRFQGDLAELRVFNQSLDDLARSRVEADLMQRWCSTSEVEQGETANVSDLYQELTSAQSPFRLEPAERTQVLPTDFQARLVSMRDELETLQKKKPTEIPQAISVQDGGPAGTPHEGFHDATVYLRGNHLKPGKVVPRGVPKVLAGNKPIEIRAGSGRRELAQWLANSENPLTARVMVNRIWQHHFGVGLVPTSANFGEMGERPSHPELLDDLAARFVASGWSIKAMHRLILLSSVYQQNSAPNAAGLAADPENRLLWRANRRRIEAESLRDSLLAVAGRLDATRGGPGFQDITLPRRSLYLMAVRTGTKADFGPLFDVADCTGIVERRFESIVAPQALFLMNDPFVIELSGALSQRIKHDV